MRYYTYVEESMRIVLEHWQKSMRIVLKHSVSGKR